MFEPRNVPPGLPSIAREFLQAVFMDGFYRGFTWGFLAGAVVALVIVALWQRGKP